VSDAVADQLRDEQLGVEDQWERQLELAEGASGPAGRRPGRPEAEVQAVGGVWRCPLVVPRHGDHFPCCAVVGKDECSLPRAWPISDTDPRPLRPASPRQGPGGCATTWYASSERRRLQRPCTDRRLGCLSGGMLGHAPQRTIREPVAGLCWPDPRWGAHHWAIGSARVARAATVAALDRRPHSDRRARPAVGVRWNRDAAPTWPCPPAWRVGRSPATRPRAVTPGERPEDTPARGDRHPARLGLRQAAYLYLLAEARRPTSVHPADLRLALSGLPQLRAAVLQPR
jgi:hypothetical protein